MKLKDIKNKLFGFSTKDLYLAELIIYESKYAGIYDGKWKYNTTTCRFQPEKYIIARKESGIEHKFIDIFTGSSFDDFNNCSLEFTGIVAAPVSPIISNKKRIKYKDAEEILYTKNTTYIKKK